MRPLLHIGYHKTGTTWLQEHVFPDEGAGFVLVGDPRTVLRQFFPPDPFAFDVDAARARLGPRIAEAEARGLVPVLSHERISGSPYGGGYDSRAVADRLAGTFPEARILAVFREQRDIILSVYKQYVTWGGAASLEQFLVPPSGINRAPIFRREFFAYHRLIGYYRRLFGARNVLALPYEVLRTDPRGFLGRIADFLDLPVGFGPPPARANVSHSALSLALKRQANRLVVRDALNPAPPFERPGINAALVRACERFDEVVPQGPLKNYERRVRRRIDETIGDQYARSNDLMSRISGVDLERFGYKK